MQNTIKVPTVAWALAALVFFPYFFPAAYNLPVFTIRLVGASLLAYFAYKSYKNGVTAAASPDERSQQRRSAWKQVGMALAVIILGFFAAVFLGLNVPSLPTMLQTAGVEGRYKDPSGNTVEFLSDGTAVFTVNSSQALWKWTVYDGGRLKLEPGPGLLGVSAAMCNYQVGKTSLRVTGCN